MDLDSTSGRGLMKNEIFYFVRTSEFVLKKIKKIYYIDIRKYFTWIPIIQKWIPFLLIIFFSWGKLHFNGTKAYIIIVLNHCINGLVERQLTKACSCSINVCILWGAAEKRAWSVSSAIDKLKFSCAILT